jgi:hypothetical protein
VNCGVGVERRKFVGVGVGVGVEKDFWVEVGVGVGVKKKFWSGVGVGSRSRFFRLCSSLELIRSD